MKMNRNDCINFTEKYPLDYFRLTKVVSFCRFSVAALNIYLALLPYSLKEHFGPLAIEEYLDDLYGTNIAINMGQYGDNLTISYSSNSLNEDYVNDFLFEKVISLIHSFINDDIQIDENLMEIKKRELIKKSLQRFKKPGSIARIKVFKQLDETNAFNYDLIGSEEDINNVTKEDLLSIHNQLKSVEYTYFFQGKYKKEKEETIKKYFPSFKEIGPLDFIPLKDCNTPIHNQENNDALNSTICALYRYKMDYSFHNLIVIRLASDILGGDSSLFFKNIREKEGLCYSIEASPFISQKVILVASSIDNSSLDKIYSSIDKIIQNVEDYICEESLDIAKMNLMSEKFLKIDDGGFLFSTNGVTLIKRGMVFSLDDELNEIQKIELKEIIDFIKELHLVSTYSVIGAK